MNTVTIKEQLEKNISWLSVIDSAVQVNHRCFSVIIHDMQIIFIDCSKQQKVISQLMKQNKHLQNVIEILHVCWSHKAVKQEKTVMCLIMNITSSKQINLFIDEELFFQNELKQCELYHEDCRLMQCFNCQKYRHITKVCRMICKCSLCAASEHRDHDCRFCQDSSKHKCANCRLKHSAWFQVCKKKKCK